MVDVKGVQSYFCVDELPKERTTDSILAKYLPQYDQICQKLGQDKELKESVLKSRSCKRQQHEKYLANESEEAAVVRRTKHAAKMRQWIKAKQEGDPKRAQRTSLQKRKWREKRLAKESQEEAFLRRLQHAAQMRKWREAKRSNQLQDSGNQVELRKQIKHESKCIQVANLCNDSPILSSSTSYNSTNIKQDDKYCYDNNNKTVSDTFSIENTNVDCDDKKILFKQPDQDKVNTIDGVVRLEKLRISSGRRDLGGNNSLSSCVISTSDVNCVGVEPDEKKIESLRKNLPLNKKYCSLLPVENENKNLRCNGCGYMLTCKMGLMEHMQDMHSKLLKIVTKILDDPQAFLSFKCSKIENKLPITFDIKNEINSQNDIMKSVSNNTNSVSKSFIDLKSVCERCGLMLSCDELLFKHMETKHRNSVNIDEIELQSDARNMFPQEEMVQCPFCYELFSIPLIGFHVWSIHKKSFNRCKNCHLVFKSLDSLKNHCIAIKNDDKKYIFLIKLQNKFSVICNLAEKKTIIKCKLCKYVSESPNRIMRHFIVIHMCPYECPRICAFCDFRAKSDDGIRGHLFSMHPEPNAENFVCDKCGYKTYNKKILSFHFRNHNNHYKCEYCDYTTSLHTSIIVHRRRHTKQKPYKCDYEGCNYSCVQKSVLTVHRFSHEREKYLQCCNLCGYKTVNKYFMNSHMRDHMKGMDIYTCVQCSFTTKYKTSLKMHSILHKEAEKCLHCTFSTKYVQTMRKHMKLKHGIEVPANTAGRKPKK